MVQYHGVSLLAIFHSMLWGTGGQGGTVTPLCINIMQILLIYHLSCVEHMHTWSAAFELLPCNKKKKSNINQSTTKNKKIHNNLQKFILENTVVGIIVDSYCKL